MAEANFDLNYLDEGSDDESIFITQTAREEPVEQACCADSENELDFAVSDMDLEEIMNSSKDSAIG